MNNFAKIFNTKYGQILITNDTRESDSGENELPSVNAFFKINDSFGVCELSLKFSDSKEGDNRCDTFFDEMTEQSAVDMVEKTILAMR